MRQIFSLVAIFLLAGCSQSKEEALVSIFEYGKTAYQPTICLSVFGADPSESLLTRIRHHNSKVVKASECHAQASGGYLFRGEPILHVMNISRSSWHGHRKISFEISYSSNAPFGGFSEIIVVEKLNEFWVPTSHEYIGIS